MRRLGRYPNEFGDFTIISSFDIFCTERNNQMVAEKTNREKVLEKFPNAFVHDDGEKVSIKVREAETIKCSECGQPHIREKSIHSLQTLGHAGSEEYAWKNAAQII